MDQQHPTPFDADTRLDETVTFRMSKLSQRYSAQAARVLRDLAGPALSEWRVLMMLATYGRLSPADITRRLQSDDSLISRATKALLKKGLVDSTPNPGDRRASYLSLTEEGKAVYSQMRPFMHHRRQAVLGALTTEEQATLRHLLGKMEARMDEMDEDLWTYLHE